MAHTPLLDPDSVEGHPLPIDELKGIKAAESIDLSGKGFGVASAMIIGTCIAGNESLCSLKYALPSETSRGCGSGRCHIITLAASLHMLPSLAVRSLAENNLTNYGKDMSGVEALAAALKDTQISDLK